MGERIWGMQSQRRIQEVIKNGKPSSRNMLGRFDSWRSKINMSESIGFAVLKPGLSCTVYLVRYVIDLRSELTSAVSTLVSFARIVNRTNCAKRGSLYRPRGKRYLFKAGRTTNRAFGDVDSST